MLRFWGLNMLHKGFIHNWLALCFSVLVLASIIVPPAKAADCNALYASVRAHQNSIDRIDNPSGILAETRQARACFPASAVDKVSYLYAVEAWILLQTGQLADAHTLVETFFQTIGTDAPPHSLGAMYVYRGRLAHFAGNPEKMHASYQQATRYIDAFSTQLIAGTFSLVAHHYASHGDFERATAILDRIRNRLATAETPSTHYAWGNLSHTEAKVLLQRHAATNRGADLTMAQLRAQQAVDFYESSGQQAYAAFAMVTLSRAYEASREPDRAEALLDRAALIARSYDVDGLDREIREAREQTGFVFEEDFEPPSDTPLAWPLAIGFVVGIVLTLGSVVAYKRRRTAQEMEWVEVPIIPAGTSLDAADDASETFPMRTTALVAPIDIEDVVAVDEGQAVRCVATLQVVRFFT